MKQTVKTSRAAGQLEKMFRELNKHYYNGELPEPIISLKKTPSAYGHITVGKVWQAGQREQVRDQPFISHPFKTHRGNRRHPLARDGTRVRLGTRYQGYQQSRRVPQQEL